MDANLIHDIIFYVMYAALAIAVVILVERGLYFSWAQRQALRFEKALTPDVRRASDLPESLTGRSSLPLTLILPVLEKKQTAEDREDVIWHEIHNAYRTRRILSQMNDEQLKDVGLSRHDV